MSAEEHVEIRIARCERGPEANRTPTRGEWQACFVFVLSVAPTTEWKRIFGENLHQHTWSTGFIGLSVGMLKAERFTFFCAPEQLQRNADQFRKVVDAANSDFRDLIISGDKTEDRRQAFEASVEAAIGALEL